MEEQKKRWRPSLTAYRELEALVTNLRAEINTLSSSNKHMEKELERLRSVNEALSKENESLRFDKEYVEKRGFWSRIFNR